MSELAFPIALMLLVVIGEVTILHWGQRNYVDWQDVIFNLSSGHMMLWLFRGVEVTCYGFVAKHLSLAITAQWAPILIWVFALFAWDFCFYWLHRSHHRFGVFWAVHVVHHQGEHFNISLGVRNSWYSSVTSIPFFLPLAVLGIPLDIFVAISMLHYSVQFFNHSALTPPLGLLENIFITPAHHRVHHVKDTDYSNRNFGGTFIFWDKLFGTFSALPLPPYSYGVRGTKSSANPFWASNLPLLRYFGFPKLDPSEIRQCQSSSFGMFTAGVILFVLVVGYIYQYGYGYSGIALPQIVLFVSLVLGTFALGGMYEERAWSLPVWLIISTGMPVFFLGVLGWSQPYWWIFMGAIAVHGIGLALTYRAGTNSPKLSAGERDA